MTSDRRHVGGPLGRRLLAAFVLVAFSSVVVLTLAALVSTDRGLASVRRSERQQTATRAADLARAGATAEAAGARLVVRDVDGAMVWPGRGMGPGQRAVHTHAPVVEAPIVVDGQRVGTAMLAFSTAAIAGRAVAWSWVIGAALVALTAALVVSNFVSRRLARPLVMLAAAAHRFAAGERGVRAGIDAPGELGEVACAFDTLADEVVRAETVRRRLAADVAYAEPWGRPWPSPRALRHVSGWTSAGTRPGGAAPR